MRWGKETAGLLLAGVLLSGAGLSAQELAPRETRTSPARLVEQAELLYRSENWSGALDAWKAVLERSPDDALAWLRCGNIHHRRGQYLAAAQAYRRAAQLTSSTSARAAASGGVPGESEATVRGKALVNLAMVNLELARDALRQVRESSVRDETIQDRALAVEREMTVLGDEVRSESSQGQRKPIPSGSAR